MEAQREEEGRSRLLKALGEWLRAACARYWIYVVVIMLFVIGVTGDRMTIFRIIYMFLFLSFILMFQVCVSFFIRRYDDIQNHLYVPVIPHRIKP